MKLKGLLNALNEQLKYGEADIVTELINYSNSKCKYSVMPNHASVDECLLNDGLLLAKTGTDVYQFS